MQNLRGIVFDLYGTLYDVYSVARLCEDVYPGRGNQLSRLWRQKQLEYTWLRSLMGLYTNFERVTEDALRHSCAHLGLPWTPQPGSGLAKPTCASAPFQILRPHCSG